MRLAEKENNGFSDLLLHTYISMCADDLAVGCVIRFTCSVLQYMLDECIISRGKIYESMWYKYKVVRAPYTKSRNQAK